MTSFLHWNQGLIHTTFRIASLGKNIQVNRNIDGIHIPSITSSGCEDTVARATNGLDRSLRVIQFYIRELSVHEVVLFRFDLFVSLRGCMNSYV